MIAALQVWWRALRHYNHYGYRYIWTNLAWFLLSLPVITAPAAWAGFVAVSYKLYHGETAGLNEFWEAFKANLGRSVVMAAVNIVIVGVNVSNLVTFSQTEGVLATVVRTVWLLILAGWFVAQLYLYPLLLEMKIPTLIGGLRNALTMMLLNPLFTLGLMLPFVLLFAMGYVFIILWGLLIGGIMSAVATGAVLDRLVAAGLHRPLSDPAGTPENSDMEIT